MADYYIDKKTGAAVKQAWFDRWAMLLQKVDCLMLQARNGMGKTILVQAFLNQYFPDSCMISCRGNWEAALEEQKRSLPDTRAERLIVLDDFQEVAVDSEAVLRLVPLFQGKEAGFAHCRFMVLSRGGMPAVWKKVLQKRIAVENSEYWLDREQVRLLMQNRGMSADDLTVELCYSRSEGYPLVAVIWMNYLYSGISDAEEINRRCIQDVYGRWEQIFGASRVRPMMEMLSRLTVFDYLDRERVEVLLGDEMAARLFELSAAGTSSMIYRGDGTISFHWFVRGYFQSQFSRMPEEEQRACYQKAADYYEQKGNIVQAIRCFEAAQEPEKVTEMAILLAENGDSSVFMRAGSRYIDQLPLEVIRSRPDLISAKAVLAACRMHQEESEQWAGELQQYTKQHPEDEDALRSYLRLQIVLPQNPPEQLMDRMQEYVNQFPLEPVALRNVAATGGLPSVLNGGKDLCCYLSDVEKNSRRIQQLAMAVLGAGGEGLAEVFCGEAAYQKNDRSTAIACLTRGLSNANLRGTLKMQYAAVGAMARLFLAEGKPDTAETILENMRLKVSAAGGGELLDNLECSKVFCRLRRGDLNAARHYLCREDKEDLTQFYISDWYAVYTEATVYLSLGREAEALYRLLILQNYARNYHRICLLCKVKVLIAIALWRRGEAWEVPLLEAAEGMEQYGLVRAAADEGAALLPLWREMDWSGTRLAGKGKFLSKTEQAMSQYASLYPNYLDKTGGMQPLTAQETKVLALLAEGMSNGEIAAHMKLSVSTVKKYVSFLLHKLGAENRAEAVKTGYQHNLI